MPPDLVFLIGIAIKMAVTALFVSVATIIAEKLGPAVGGLVATLPVSAGPVYVFLALDHDAAFISASALTSLALNATTAIYNSLRPARAAAWNMAQRPTRFRGVVRDCFDIMACPLGAVVGTRSQSRCFRALLLHRRALPPRSHATDETALVRFHCPGRHGSIAGWRGSDVELPYRSRRQWRTCRVSRHLYQHHGHLALAGRRSLYSGSVGERHSRPCRLRRALLTLHMTAVPRVGRSPFSLSGVGCMDLVLYMLQRSVG